eukprot:4763065-Pleurochrysis_carterae.AAC.1
MSADTIVTSCALIFCSFPTVLHELCAEMRRILQLAGLSLLKDGLTNARGLNDLQGPVVAMWPPNNPRSKRRKTYARVNARVDRTESAPQVPRSRYALGLLAFAAHLLRTTAHRVRSQSPPEDRPLSAASLTVTHCWSGGRRLSHDL